MSGGGEFKKTRCTQYAFLQIYCSFIRLFTYVLYFIHKNTSLLKMQTVVRPGDLGRGLLSIMSAAVQVSNK